MHGVWDIGNGYWELGIANRSMYGVLDMGNQEWRMEQCVGNWTWKKETSSYKPLHLIK